MALLYLLMKRRVVAIKKHCWHFISNYIKSHAIHTIHAVIDYIRCKAYSTCKIKIQKADKIMYMLQQDTYKNGQIQKLLKEFMNMQSPILHSLKPTCISTYDLITKEIKAYPALLNSSTESISFDGRVFILNANLIGGLSEFDFDHSTLIAKQNAGHPKITIGIYECDQFIYSIAGQINKQGEVRYCEKYDVKADKWGGLPNLKDVRAYNCAVQFDHQWIYTFYGSNGKKFAPSIERLSIMHPSSWANVETKLDESSLLRKSQAMQINKKDILIIGGSTEHSDCFVFHDSKKYVHEIRKYKSLYKASLFYNTSAPILYEGRIYAIDSSRLLHVCTIKDNKWELFDDKWKQWYYENDDLCEMWD